MTKKKPATTSKSRKSVRTATAPKKVSAPKSASARKTAAPKAASAKVVSAKVDAAPTAAVAPEATLEPKAESVDVPTMSADERHQLIKQAAFRRAQARGFQPGRELDD